MRCVRLRCAVCEVCGVRSVRCAVCEVEVCSV